MSKIEDFSAACRSVPGVTPLANQRRGQADSRHSAIVGHGMRRRVPGNGAGLLRQACFAQ